MKLIKKERILLARPLTSMDIVQFRMKVHTHYTMATTTETKQTMICQHPFMKPQPEVTP